MNITFLGATKTVTGSNFLVEAAGKKFLVDLGMYQGQAKEIMLNTDSFLFEVDEIDFMILTHAHIDHSGRIPKLYKEGYRKNIYATKPTVDLCTIMLPDSGHIQEMEVEWINRKRKREGKHAVDALYTQEDAEKCLELFVGYEYNQMIYIDDNICFRFRDAGHMLGSSIIEIWIKEEGTIRKVVFTGDLGNNDTPLLREPEMIEDADFLVIESTYGGRLHNKEIDKAERFLEIVYETIEKHGKVIIPSFAVGRTQEILFEINKIRERQDSDEFVLKYRKLMNVPVYVDSPLAISATEIFMKNIYWFDEETEKLMLENKVNPLEFPGLKLARSLEESKALNESNESSIIISASGMCEVGRIKHHLKHNLWNPNSTILFVGYQAEGTLGRKIVDGVKRVKIFGEEVAINARIEYIEGYSGHADQEGLLRFINSFSKKPKNIFLVHGEKEGQVTLKNKIEEKYNIDVIIPDYGEEYRLAEVAKVENTLEMPNKHKYIRLEIIERMETLKEEIQDMEIIVKEEKLDKDVDDQEIVKIKEKLVEIERQIVSIVEN